MILLTARAKIVDTLDPRAGGFRRTAKFAQFGQGEDILKSTLFASVSPVYHLSADPRDYLFLVARALTADVPNSNGDMFPKEELLRFDPLRQMQVYQTFTNGPLHWNHQAADRTRALGFIPDVAWVDGPGGEAWVDCLVAVDRTKNPRIAHELENGQRNEFSMGCLAGLVICSGCHAEARNEDELCRHLKTAKMPRGPYFEKCHQVTYTELSSVDDAADNTALTRAVLGRIASAMQSKEHQLYDCRPPQEFGKAASSRVPLLDRMGLSAEDRAEIVRDLTAQLPHMSRGMEALTERLLQA